MRIQKKNYYDSSWRSNPNAVYVGRPSRWGNPYKIGRDGTREQVLAKYRRWLENELIDNPYFLEPLRGKDLVCFCKLTEACHADIIAEFLKACGGV